MPRVISYQRLFDKMNELGIKKQDLRNSGMNASVINNLSKNRSVTTTTILQLCNYFDCQPGDLMEVITIDPHDLKEANHAQMKIAEAIRKNTPKKELRGMVFGMLTSAYENQYITQSMFDELLQQYVETVKAADERGESDGR